jgi:hypothetical protein
MKKIIRLTESDLIRLVKRVINEQLPSEDRGPKINVPRLNSLHDVLIQKGFYDVPGKSEKSLTMAYAKGNSLYAKVSQYGNNFIIFIQIETKGMTDNDHNVKNIIEDLAKGAQWYFYGNKDEYYRIEIDLSNEEDVKEICQKITEFGA